MKHGIAEIVLCSAGLMVSLIPFLVYTDPVWGVDGFSDGGLWATDGTPGVTILQVVPGSPAASAGLKAGDRIVAVDGKPAEFAAFRARLAAIGSGQRVTLEGRRGEGELRLECRGEPRSVEAVFFLDWQFIAVPILLALLLLHIATEPLEPPPLWRAIVATLGGLAVMAAAAIVEAGSSWPWTWVWRSKAISHVPDAGLHYAVAAAAALTALILASLGSFTIRALLKRKATGAADLGVGSGPPR